MVTLLQTVRAALDAYGNSLSQLYHFILTAACPALFGSQYMCFAEISQYIDFCNFMGYDYAGPWSNMTAHQSNLFHLSTNPASTPFNTDNIITNIAQGIPLHKLVLGIPIYSRAFGNMAGPGEPFSGSCIYDYRNLPSEECTEAYDKSTGSSSCYSNRE